MARARNIKPGFYKNELLLGLDPLTRILFSGLWTLADREGRLEDRPMKIKIEVLPMDNCNVDDMLNQLEDTGFIDRYLVEGSNYIQIVKWSAHQKPHLKEAPSVIPVCTKKKQDSSHPRTKHNLGSGQTQPSDNLSDGEKSFLLDSFNLDSLIPDSLISSVQNPTEVGEQIPLTPDITEQERHILKSLSGVVNYKFEFKKDLDFIRQLFIDFPSVAIQSEITKWTTNKLDKPLDKKSNPRSQLRNWCLKAIDFQKKRGEPLNARRTDEHHGQSHGSSKLSNFF